MLSYKVFFNLFFFTSFMGIFMLHPCGLKTGNWWCTDILKGYLISKWDIYVTSNKGQGVGLCISVWIGVRIRIHLVKLGSVWFFSISNFTFRIKKSLAVYSILLPQSVGLWKIRRQDILLHQHVQRHPLNSCTWNYVIIIPFLLCFIHLGLTVCWLYFTLQNYHFEIFPPHTQSS